MPEHRSPTDLLDPNPSPRSPCYARALIFVSAYQSPQVQRLVWATVQWMAAAVLALTHWSGVHRTSSFVEGNTVHNHVEREDMWGA